MDLASGASLRVSFDPVRVCPATGDKEIAVRVDGACIGYMSSAGDAEYPEYWCDGTLESAGFQVFEPLAADAKRDFTRQWTARVQAARNTFPHNCEDEASPAP